MTLAYVALGSNLGNSRQHVLAAIEALADLPATQLLQASALYLTPPWGMLEQPPFINAAVQLDTGMTPHALLGALLEIERKAGRIRAERNGPRILDLDLLHVEGVRVDDDDLVLPHPRLAERVFVLLPLNDVAPALELPGHGTVAQVLAQLDAGDCQRLP